MLQIVMIVMLLVFAVVTAASETSITVVSRVKLRRMAAAGSRTANVILRILEAPEKFFGTILVANNIVDVLLASIVTAIMIHLLGDERWGVLSATFLATVAIIISEVTAKTIAVKRAERVSFALARTAELLMRFLSPIVDLLARFINFVIRLLGLGAGTKASLVTEEEIRAFITIGEEEGAIGKDKGRMLAKVFEFGDTLVRSVMTPQSAMVALDVNSKYEEIMRTVLESGYSRLPVYKDAPANIIGVVNVKDLLNFWEHKELIILQDMIYQPTFVSGSRKVNDLLNEFQKGSTHMAIVVDAQGKIEGIVTLEDLLEEIVGEIADEYDLRKPEIEKISDERYAVSDRCRLRRLNREFRLDLPEREFATVGTYVRQMLKRSGEKTDQIRLDGWAFVVKKTEGSRLDIELVRIPQP